MYRKDDENTKNQNPFDSANLVSKFFYWWLKDIFKLGFERAFQEDDLSNVSESHKSENVMKKFERLWDEELKKPKPSLLRVMIKTHLLKVTFAGFLFSAVAIPCKMLTPLFLGYLISYFTTNPNEFNEQQAYLIATGLSVSLILTVITFHPAQLYYFHSSLRLKIACCSLICRKILEISKFSMRDGISGQAINLLSNDVARLDYMTCFINNVWSAPVGSLIAGFLIYQQIGYSGIIGLVILVFTMPIQTWLSTKSAQIITKAATQTDNRVKFMLSVLKGIQTVKMYAWEISFGKLLRLIRTREMNEIRKGADIKATRLSFHITTDIAIFASFVVYVLLGNQITAQKAFVSIAYFNFINHELIEYWPLALSCVFEGVFSAIMRIEKFLVYENLQTVENTENQNSNSMVGINLQNASAVWNIDGVNSLAVSAINLKINQTENLTAVIGHVGSGKTSLFEVILKEIPLTEGSIEVNGIVSYAAQQPWIFEGSIRENILFTETFEPRRYRQVIEACALVRDFELFSKGDQTLVGDRGVSLSGGQKARINLARAVYRKADIYLLDDPLSAVDVRVGKQIYNQCVRDFLRNKIVLLATHQVQYLQDVETILVMNNGEIKARGNFDSVMSTEICKNFIQPEKIMSNNEEDIDDELENKNSESMETDDKNIETQELGKVNKTIYRSYFMASESITFISVVGILLIGTQILYSLLNYFISVWVEWEEIHNKQQRALPSFIDPENWTTEKFVYFYSGGVALLAIFTIGGAFSFYRICVRISVKLHERLYHGVIRATMYFFNTNSSGRVLNRFSKDLGLVDTQLPMVILDCLRFFLQLFGIVVIVSIVNYWLLIPTLVMLIIFITLRTIFLKSARNIKRVEAITRSPVFAHTTALLQGLSTIRAFKAENEMMKEFYNLQDINSSAWFLFVASSRGFAFYIDFISSLYITSIVYSFLIIGNGIAGSNVGLAITQAINLIGMCNWGLRQTAELENQMTSVERIFEYVNLEQEKSLETPHATMNNLPKSFGVEGSIELQNVFLKYSKDGENVLMDVNFKIESGKKIGIVGRTGAGKTSLIQAIFDLAVISGVIKIDDVTTSRLGLHAFRKIISVVPQDPVLFVGTLRENLDPTDDRNDDEIWNSLEQVEMKETIKNLPDGLNTMISEDGANFSIGQRQLFCLARAILKNNKILILDEATANIDFETDQLIQETIRNRFSNCTVLIIAHRLNTIIDCDKVMVMDSGKVVEFDSPVQLSKNSSSLFSKMIQEAGIDLGNINKFKSS